MDFTPSYQLYVAFQTRAIVYLFLYGTIIKKVWRNCIELNGAEHHGKKYYKTLRNEQP